jgi:capsular exopolysaccharide synthesis family protein
VAPAGFPTLEQFKSKVTADVPKSQALINLHVTDANPARAAVIANALGKAFVTVVPGTEQKILTTDASGNPKAVAAVKLTIIQPAVVPGQPIKPNKSLNIGLGIVLGLLIGIGVAVVREVLDNTVKGAEDFESLGIPLLAQIAYDKRTSRSVIAFRADAHSARSESYRQLRTNLQFVDVDHPPKIIAVTSAVPGEGKSTTAINLAAALAEAGSRVCLIEADLRRPSIARALGLVTDVGFTTVVIGKAPIETVLQNAGRNLAVLTSGPIPPNPSELLVSQHARQVIYDIAEKVDFVVIDTPPLLPVTDGAEIATIADATLLVHRASKTTKDQANRSLQALAKVGRRPVGVVLNMVSRNRGGEYSYEYGYYYSAYRPDKKGKGGPGPGKSRTEVMSAVDLDESTGEMPTSVPVAAGVQSATAPAAETTAPAAETTTASATAVAVLNETDDGDAAERRARHQRDDEAASAPRGRFGRTRRAKRGATAAPAESAVTEPHTAAEPAAEPARTEAVREPDPDLTKTVTLPPITVNGRAREGADPSVGDDPSLGGGASSAMAADADADTTGAVGSDAVPAEADAPTAELTPVAATSEEIPQAAAATPAGDEFADDYPPFSAAEDEFTPVPPGNLDDVTIHLEGQDELPLEQRQPLVEFDEDALDEALGVKSTDKRR